MATKPAPKPRVTTLIIPGRRESAPASTTPGLSPSGLIRQVNVFPFYPSNDGLSILFVTIMAFGFRRQTMLYLSSFGVDI